MAESRINEAKYEKRTKKPERGLNKLSIIVNRANKARVYI